MDRRQPKPFKIAVPQNKLNILRKKLQLTTWPNQVTLADRWSRGPPLEDVKSLVGYWIDKFDWRQQEEKVNQLPQYTVDVDIKSFGDYNIHFVHQQSSQKDAIPLLFVHGWPGSFIEVTKILPSLLQSDGTHPAFHVVAPSLIDFGFSQANLKEGFGIDQQAEACHNLMQCLGYTRYVVQGGDIGYFVARLIAMQFPEACVAHHTNMPVPNPPSETEHPELVAKIAADGGLGAKDEEGLAATQRFTSTGMAYALMHATRPETIGYNLADSPVGLLAWIYEKLVAWVDHYQWTADEILTWVCLYLFSRAGPAAAQRIYLEMSQRQPVPAIEKAAAYCSVPLGTSRFKDLYQLPMPWDHTLGPVVFQRRHDSGGHFPAWECPDVLVSDIRAMFGRQDICSMFSKKD